MIQASSLENSTVPSSSPSSVFSEVTAPSIPLTIAEGTGSLKLNDREAAFSHTITKASSSSPIQVALSFVNENLVQPTERFLAAALVLASHFMRREVLVASTAIVGTLAIAEKGKCGILGLPQNGDPAPFLNTGAQAVSNGQLVAVQVTFNGRTAYASGVPLDPYDVATDKHVVQSSIGQFGTVSILPLSSNYMSPSSSLIPASGISVMPGGYGTPGYTLGSGPDLAIIHTATPIPGVTGSVSFAAPPVQGQILEQADFGVVETAAGPIAGLTGSATGGFARVDLNTTGSPTWYEETEFGYPNSPNQNIGGSDGASGAGEWTLDRKLAGLIVYGDNPDGLPSTTEFQYFNPAETQFAFENSSMSTPEPTTFALFGCAAGTLLLYRPRRKTGSS